MDPLNIAIIEPDISNMSGRAQTMVAFADFFSINHYVSLHTDISNPTKACNKDNFIQAYNCENLTKDEVLFKVPLGKQKYDIVLVPYANINNSDMEQIQTKLPDTRVICWTITPYQKVRGICKEYWIPSHTQKLEMLKFRAMPIEEKAFVIYPPHDYSFFRRYTNPFIKRPYDLIWVGRNNESKRLNLYLKFLKAHPDLKGFACIIGNEDEINIYLKRSKITNLEWVINTTRRDVASSMGEAKILFHPSIDECSSLAIYEAMNAGCWPVVFGTAACCEQMGPVGDVFYRDQEVPIIIKSLLKHGYDVELVKARGEMFDIERTKGRIEARLRS